MRPAHCPLPPEPFGSGVCVPGGSVHEGVDVGVGVQSDVWGPSGCPCLSLPAFVA